ncbi:MAG: 23S rRNA (pseudouridine(1915)-N(3))-methyltransferase RlmH [Candidatus Aenigmarchaeota archaeon]|nr:23S rRNA (pseudouridine(1915)-N(3))-methyltransferase RlmH [Candidatus Aenigmarchaeota archaeon]
MIKIIAIGKNINFLKNAELEYETRIKHFTKLEIIELKEDKSKTPKEIMLKEAKKIKDVIKGQKYIALEIEGQTPTTEKFTDIIKNNTEKNTIFVIGGAYGLDDEIKNKANKLISLSKMTFTHQIARILLLEQIYRAQTIINNRNYHK